MAILGRGHKGSREPPRLISNSANNKPVAKYFFFGPFPKPATLDNDQRSRRALEAG